MTTFDFWFLLVYYSLLLGLGVWVAVAAWCWRIPAVRWLVLLVDLVLAAIVFFHVYAHILPPFADPFWVLWFQ